MRALMKYFCHLIVSISIIASSASGMHGENTKRTYKSFLEENGEEDCFASMNPIDTFSIKPDYAPYHSLKRQKITPVASQARKLDGTGTWGNVNVSVSTTRFSGISPYEKEIEEFCYSNMNIFTQLARNHQVRHPFDVHQKPRTILINIDGLIFKPTLFVNEFRNTSIRPTIDTNVLSLFCKDLKALGFTIFFTTYCQCRVEIILDSLSHFEYDVDSLITINLNGSEDIAWRQKFIVCYLPTHDILATIELEGAGLEWFPAVYKFTIPNPKVERILFCN